MKKIFKKVPIKGITAEEVLALWQGGELYRVREEEKLSEADLLALCQKEALEYVSAINAYVSEKWRPIINKVLESVIYDRSFASDLVMKKKHKLNRYFLTNLVFNLQLIGIYIPAEEVSQLKLHLILENTAKLNGIYKNCIQYPVSPEQRKRLRAIAEDYKRF